MKKDEHIPSGYLVFTIWTFDGRENMHNTYKDEDCRRLCIRFVNP